MSDGVKISAYDLPDSAKPYYRQGPLPIFGQPGGQFHIIFCLAVQVLQIKDRASLLVIHSVFQHNHYEICLLTLPAYYLFVLVLADLGLPDQGLFLRAG